VCAQERELRAERERKAKEAAELAACTFWPATNPRNLPKPAPVAVRGLSTFMGHKAAAARLREEAAARERRAFVLDAAARPPRTSVTVPEPFEALEERRQWAEERKAAGVARVEAELASQHPFRPSTTEGAKQAMLRRIMAASYDD
jgi:hypothetical protein